jgi:hypothetical protein
MTLGRVAITTEEMLSNEAIAQFKFNGALSNRNIYSLNKSICYQQFLRI